MQEREKGRKPYNFCFVDVETTGMRPFTDRVIDIAVIRVENGAVVQTMNTLVQPGHTIAPYITSIAGITNEMLADASTFDEVALDLQAILKDAVFVAHNAHFDYGFIKNEFRRIGMEFFAPMLCTVKLSRALYPKERHHDLDSLMARHSIVCSARHRAMPDAQVMHEWLALMHERHGEGAVTDAIEQLLVADTLPPLLHRSVLSKLPDTPGIYFFYGTQHELLYVGKSKNIRTRVQSHFSGAGSSNSALPLTRQGKRLYQQTARIESRETPGELSALLLEAKTIKTHMPLYNRALRRTQKLVVATKIVDKNGYATIVLSATPSIALQDTTLVMFRSLAQAKAVLRALAKEHMLCTVLLGVDKTTPCFGSHLGTCNGACFGKEDPDVYNTRFDAAFAARAIRRWPYKGPIVIEEKSSVDVGAVFIVDDWRLKKWSFYNHGDEEEMKSDNYFDYDTYKILARYIQNPAHRKNIRTLDTFEIQQHLNELEGEAVISYT